MSTQTATSTEMTLETQFNFVAPLEFFFRRHFSPSDAYTWTHTTNTSSAARVTLLELRAGKNNNIKLVKLISFISWMYASSERKLCFGPTADFSSVTQRICGVNKFYQKNHFFPRWISTQVKHTKNNHTKKCIIYQAVWLIKVLGQILEQITI